MSDSTDAGRQEAQRQTLTGLLTRFTADRDELYAGMQECRTRLADLLTRLDAQDPAAAGGTPPGGTPHPVFDEMPALVEQVRAHDAEVAEARALAAAANEQAQEAMRLAAQQGDAAVTWRAELHTLEHKIDGATSTFRLDVGKEVREAMGELRKDLARVESALRERIEEKERTAAENLVAETQLLRRQVENIADSVSERSGHSDESAGMRAALDELRRNVLALQSASAQRPGPHPSAAPPDWETEVACLRDQVKELATHQVREAASATHLAEIRRAIDELRAELGRVERSGADRPAPPAVPTGDLEVRVKSLQEKVEELTRQQGKETASAEYLVAVSAAIEHLRGDLARVETVLEERIEVRMRNAASERDAELRRLREKIEEMTGVRSAIESLRLQLGRTESAVGDRIDARIRNATQLWEAQAASLRAGMQELTVVQRNTLARSAAASVEAAFATCARMAEEVRERLATLAARASAVPVNASRTVRTRLADVLESTLRRVSALLP